MGENNSKLIQEIKPPKPRQVSLRSNSLDSPLPTKKIAPKASFPFTLSVIVSLVILILLTMLAVLAYKKS